MKKTKNVISYSVAHAQAIAPWFILNYIQKNIDANAGECLKEGIDVICIGSWLRENHTTSWYVSDLVELDRCPKHVNPLVRRDLKCNTTCLTTRTTFLESGCQWTIDSYQLLFGELNSGCGRRQGPLLSSWQMELNIRAITTNLQ